MESTCSCRQRIGRAWRSAFYALNRAALNRAYAVPLQDFTSDSDIDWSQSVADIDRQLYAKYGLDDEEIQFIESHVKEMD